MSCSLSQFGWQVEPDTESKPDDKGLVEDFDPLTLKDEEITVEPLPEQSESASDEPVLAENTATVSSAPDMETEEEVLGWRVQLMAVSDEQGARQAKQRAMMRFNDNVYMILDGPSYKIRIGDCVTYEAARAVQSKAIEKGYTDAWIVRSKVSSGGNSPDSL